MSGLARIPQTRKTPDSRTVEFSSDEVRERILPDIPKDFRRTGRTFDVDESRNVLTFSVTDEELPPNIPPPGIVEVSASHDIHSVKMPLQTATL